MASSIVPVIQLWEKFLAEGQEADIQQFARWILQRGDADGALKPVIRPRMASHGDSMKSAGDSAKALNHISRLHRYMQMVSKPVIKKLGFGKDHEYVMLTYVFLLKEPNKKELARKMLLESSTTVEISNRLVKRGYLKESVDTEDKRSTRLALTEEGENKLFESYPAMEKNYTGFLNCLTAPEQVELVRLLGRVEQYHSTAFENVDL